MIKASRKTIKMKTPEGEVKVAILGESPGAEEYLQHISSFVRMLERKKVTDDMLKLAKAVASLKAPVRRLTTAPQGEKPPDKTVRLEKLEAAVNALVEANVHEKNAKLETVYELFRKTLKEDPELQWDHIVTDMHTKDPWEDLKRSPMVSAGSRANPSGNASISISARYILSTPRSSRGCTYYVTSRSL